MEWTSCSNNNKKKRLGLCQKAPKEAINSNLKKKTWKGVCWGIWGLDKTGGSWNPIELIHIFSILSIWKWTLQTDSEGSKWGCTLFHCLANTSKLALTWAGVPWLFRRVTSYRPSCVVIRKLLSIYSTEQNWYGFREFYISVFSECYCSSVAFIYMFFKIHGQHTYCCY